MLIARWEITAKFGYKMEMVNLLKRWHAEIGPQVGWTEDNSRMLTGSIGALESVIVSEVEGESLAELEAAWAKMAELGEHADFSKEAEPYCVSGTNRWEIYRVL